MKNTFPFLAIFLISCLFHRSTIAQPNNATAEQEYSTANFVLEDSIFVVPAYINTTTNCLNRGAMAAPQELRPEIVISYFSEYSSIYFFTKITAKQIIFLTFNETGTPKPDLLFYVANISKEVYETLYHYFKENKNHQELKYTHDSAQHIMVSDKIKNDFGEMWGGDKFPLTKIEATWLVKRHLAFLGELSNSTIGFNQELLKPVFYNLCAHENELNHWKTLYPEIQDHELKY